MRVSPRLRSVVSTTRTCALTLLAALAILYASVLPGSSQLGRIGIELSAVGESDAAHAGTSHRVALQARLDPGFHINSNKPLDKSLIPTILTLVPPDGITLDAVAWPEPVMLEQAGTDQPLEVFEEKFVVGAALALAPGLAAGEYIVPGTLQYQACDETMCYFPTTAALEFQLAIVPQSQPLTSMYRGAIRWASVQSGRWRRPKRYARNAWCSGLVAHTTRRC